MNASSRFINLPAILLTLCSATPVTGRTSGESGGDPELQQLIRQLYVQGQFHGGVLIAEGETILVGP